MRLPWFLPLAFVVVVGSSLGALELCGNRMPVGLTNLLSLSFVFFLPAVPLLKPLGLIEGEYYRGPNAIGLLLVMAVYCAILFGLGKLIQRICGWKS